MNDTAVASKTPRIVLAVGGLAYLVGVFAASANPGPRAWALHSLGFTPTLVRMGGLAVLAAGVALLFVGVLGAAPAPGRPETTPRRASATKRSKDKRANRRFFLPLLLVPLAVIFAHLRARTQFLGDGTVWLSGLQANVVTAKNEPLSATLWLGVTSFLRMLHVPIEANTLAVLSILCGLAAAVFAWGIARELAPQKPGTVTAFVLLLTLATTQLFCGYIESYPPVAMFVFGFLWLGLRRIRGEGPALLLPIAFALCVTGHLATGVLAPAYLFLALRGPEPKTRRAALAAAGPALAVALLLLLGSNPAEWLRSFATAIRGGDVANLSTTVVKPAYGVLSVDHLVDFGNALLLILPVPLLLLLARFVELRGRVTPLAPDTTFLALAAIPGVALAALLRLPLPPAQDWDLMSILLLPAAVFAIRAGRSIFAAPRVNLGLAILACGALLPFLLVNANETTAIRRFEAILSPEAKITSFARAYGNYALWKHFSGRGDPASAHPYAVRAHQSEPGNPRYWTNVGLDLYQMKRYDEALPYLEEGAKRGPNQWVLRYNLGLCLKEKGRYEEAADEFGVAAGIGGGRPEVLHNLGIALFRSGRPDSAIVIWQDVARRWPAYAKALQTKQGGAPPP
jgi:tetratricopeptide (TPR) repeat protein